MAVPANGRYVRVEMNVWYDVGTQRVHVTSADPDLAGRFHDYIRPGTAADAVCRELLARHGKLPTGAQTKGRSVQR
jgi:hypothetical protein